jgi:NADPH-dependent 2,4-dienoyl-CoA reductase/sulfur reductase-like enzyme
MSRPVADVREADVAVVGAGPAGIAAATTAAEAGKRVVLFDDAARPGGQIWRHRAGRVPPRAARWLSRLERSGAVRVLNSEVVSILPGFSLLAESAGRPVSISAKAVILATGARERFLPFPGWTLPNVIGIGGAEALLRSGASFAGKRIVIAGSGPLLLPVAASLATNGARLAVVAEQAPAGAVARFAAGLWRSPRTLLDAIGYRKAFHGTPYRFGTWVVEAHGQDRVTEAALTDGKRTWAEGCDFLCTGFGLVPATELARLAGCRIAGGVVVVDGAQRTSVPGIFCAGEPTGIAGVEASLVEGEIAGLAAATLEREANRLGPARRRIEKYGRKIERAFSLRPELRRLARPETVVCRCEDVDFGSLDSSWSAREAKLYTRAGMGPCQARVCGPALRYLFGWESDTVRVPIAPVLVGTLKEFGARTRTPEENR